MKKIITLLFFSLSLISCSTLQERRMRENIVKNIKSKNYNEALKIAKSNEFYENKNSILLKNLELFLLFLKTALLFQDHLVTEDVFLIL